jgi:hypothetical protein
MEDLKFKVDRTLLTNTVLPVHHPKELTSLIVAATATHRRKRERNPVGRDRKSVV